MEGGKKPQQKKVIRKNLKRATRWGSLKKQALTNPKPTICPREQRVENKNIGSPNKAREKRNWKGKKQGACAREERNRMLTGKGLGGGNANGRVDTAIKADRTWRPKRGGRKDFPKTGK